MRSRRWYPARLAGGNGAGGLLASGPGFIAARYVVAASVGAETLLLASVLGPTTYGRYALIAQTASLLIFVGLGSTPGYVIAYYDDPDGDLTDIYLAGAIPQWLLGSIVAAIALYLYEPFLALSALLFIIYIPYFVTEPMMRVRNRFTVAALPKGAASLVTVVLAAAMLLVLEGAGDGSLTLAQAIALMFVGNLVVYAIYYRKLVRTGDVKSRAGRVLAEWARTDTWKRYWRLFLIAGVPAHVSTIAFGVFNYMDRFFIEKYRTGTQLGVFSVAWQLSQGALLMLSSLNTISSVRIGENLHGSREQLRRELTRQLKITCASAIGAMVALLAACVVLDRTILAAYDGLVLMTLVLSAGYFSFSVGAAVASLLMYEKRNTQVAGAYCALLVVDLVANLVAIRYRLWYGFPVLVSTIGLVVIGIWLPLYAYRIVGRPKGEGGEVP